MSAIPVCPTIERHLTRYTPAILPEVPDSAKARRKPPEDALSGVAFVSVARLLASYDIASEAIFSPQIEFIFLWAGHEWGNRLSLFLTRL